MHKILYVESHVEIPWPDDSHAHWENVIWHVGNSSNYLENPQCPGPYPDTIYDVDPSSATSNTSHKSGNEIDCNLSGKYITMVSDMSSVDWTIIHKLEAHICSLGIFGTPYVRDEPLSPTIEVI